MLCRAGAGSAEPGRGSWQTLGRVVPKVNIHRPIFQHDKGWQLIYRRLLQNSSSSLADPAWPNCGLASCMQLLVMGTS